MTKGSSASAGASAEDLRLQRVLAWLGLSQSLKAHSEASTAAGAPVVLNTALRALCQQRKPELVGELPLQRVQVSQWADLASLLVQRDDAWLAERMVKVEEHLQAHSYLATNKFTLADACLFDVIATRLDANPGLAASLQALSNVKRWFAHIQELAYRNADGASVALPKRVALPLEHAPLEVPRLTFGGKNRGASEQKTSEGKPGKQSKKQKQPPQEAAAAPAAEGSSKKKTKQQPADATAAAAAAAAGEQPAQAKKKEKKEKKEKKAESTETKAPESDDIDVSKLDLRVGVILRAWEHESSEKLFCEEIDIGEEAPRMIASGLRAFYTLAELQGRKVLVVANLKGRNMGGFTSQGMVVCASNDDHTQVKFVEVPASAKPGDRVTVDGFPGEPASAAQVQKKKVLEKVLPELVTDSNGVPTFRGAPFKIGDEICTSGLSNAHVG